MINHEHKFVFIHIPKTGGSSIESIFMDGLGETHDYPGKHSILKKKSKDGFFTFAFVRNPYDKILSHYTFFAKKTKMGLADYYDGGSFPGFVHYYCAQQRQGWKRNDFLPQFDYLTLTGKTCDVDYVGRFENMQNDFNEICDRIGIKRQELPHKNKTNHKHYTEYYDDETREIVSEKYAKDIEYFGYGFDIEE